MTIKLFSSKLLSLSNKFPLIVTQSSPPLTEVKNCTIRQNLKSLRQQGKPRKCILSLSGEAQQIRCFCPRKSTSPIMSRRTGEGSTGALRWARLGCSVRNGSLLSLVLLFSIFFYFYVVFSHKKNENNRETPLNGQPLRSFSA